MTRSREDIYDELLVTQCRRGDLAAWEELVECWHDRLTGLMMIANGLAFLIGAAVYWLNFKIEEAFLVTREKLLQLELRLAELAERR